MKDETLPGKSSTRQAAMSMERIDTHAHLEDKIVPLMERARNCAEAGGMLNKCTGRMLAEGCRTLYGIDPGIYLRPDSSAEIFQKAQKFHEKGVESAFSHALDVAKIKLQFVFTGIKADCFPYKDLNARVRYLAYIDPGLKGHWQWPTPDHLFSSENYYENLCKCFGRLDNLDAFLAALDATVDSWRRKGVVGLKTGMAYTSGLFISDPTRQQARTAFARRNEMTEIDFRVVNDFAFRHVLDACGRNSLPVVIHTGVMVWGHGNLAQANPLHLHNLLVDKRFKDLTFVLLHGGLPYLGETTYLASMFPNVILDFTFVAYMSRPTFRRALAEWLEAVPTDRMCWGSDSSCPESIVGVDRVTRTEIAHVLESMISDGMLDEKTAMQSLTDMYVNTAKRVFRL